MLDTSSSAIERFEAFVSQTEQGLAGFWQPMQKLHQQHHDAAGERSQYYEYTVESQLSYESCRRVLEDSRLKQEKLLVEDCVSSLWDPRQDAHAL